MRIMILTQNENIYLPKAVGTVCEALRSDIVCIVTAPAMSTHGNAMRGALKNIILFGVSGTINMGARILHSKIRSAFAGNGGKSNFFSIRKIGESLNLPYHHVSRVNSPEFTSICKTYAADLLISMSCPQVVGKKVRNLFPKGCINVHGAPLPKYRGLMPAFWVLRNGEIKTASTVHELAEKLDDGQIYHQVEVDIEADETWDSLVRKTKAAGAYALIEVVEKIRSGQLMGRPNPEEEATYFSFPTAADRKAFRRAGRRFF